MTTQTTEAPTPAQWRAAMGYFPTGVSVVTSWKDGRPIGAPVNALCSVSLEPPLLLICLTHDNPLRLPIEHCGVFGINFLGGDDGAALIRQFVSEPVEARFDGQDYRSIANGAPQLMKVPVFVDCTLEHMVEAGDHMVVIGRGIRTEHRSEALPLLYHRGGFPAFAPAS